METSTNGAGPAAELAAGHEDQGGVAELGLGAGGRASREGVPDPELVEQAKRRSFTAEYRARILAEADACVPGEVGELLRREGLYTSHLTCWRKQRKDGALRELGKPRGRKPADKRDAQIATLTRRAERAEAELQNARRVIEIQGNVFSAAGRDARDRQRAEEHRAMIEATVEELSPLIGTRPACRALGASPATIHRRRRPPEAKPLRPRPTPARALSEPERQQVLDVLHSERFVDVSPEETWATLLDEGTYLCSTRTMYRILAATHGGVRDRRDQLTTRPTRSPSCSPPARTSCGLGTCRS
jgi:putative transposase